MGLIVALIAVAIAIGLVVLWPRDPPTIDRLAFGFASAVIPAVVESVEGAPCSYAAEETCNTVVFTDGSGTFSQEFPDDPGQPQFEPGDPVISRSRWPRTEAFRPTTTTETEGPSSSLLASCLALRLSP